MGFLDSLFKTAVNKVVDKAFDKAADGISESIKDSNANTNTNQNNNISQSYTANNQLIQIIHPDISGEQVKTYFTFTTDEITGQDIDHFYCFEKTNFLYEATSGAAEIDTMYYVVDSKDELYNEDDKLDSDAPYITFGTKECIEKDAVNVVKNQVVNNPYIYEKIQCDKAAHKFVSKEFGTTNYAARHYIIYNFYPFADKSLNNSLVLSFKQDCPTENRIRAIKAFELIASTLRVE